MSDETCKCPKCGTENDAENASCGECGTKKPEANSSQSVKGNQKEVSRNKTKIVTIVCCLIAFLAAVGAGIYIFEEEKEAREQ